MFFTVKFDAPAPLSQTVRPPEIALINTTEPFTVRTSKSCVQVLIKPEIGIVSETAMRCLAIRTNDAFRFDRVNTPRDSRPVRRANGLISSEADPSGKRGDGSRTEDVLATCWQPPRRNSCRTTSRKDRRAATTKPGLTLVPSNA